MVGALGEGEVERRLPVGGALARRAVDEIEADLQPGGARPRDDLRDPLGVVRPLERREHVRHRGLHPEAALA